MKRFLLLFFLSIGIKNVYSSGFIEFLLRQDPAIVNKVERKNDSLVFYFPCPFAQFNFDRSSLDKWLSNHQLRKISLVYTRYKKAASFNQVELNRNRYKKLFSIIHYLENNTAIQWSRVEQTGCSSQEEGNSYFHGFILEGTLSPTREIMESEFSFITGYLAEETKLSDTSLISFIKADSAKVKSADEERKCPEYPGGYPAFRSYIDRNIKKPNVMGEYLREGFVTVKVKILSDGHVTETHIRESLYSWADQEAARLVSNMPQWEPGSTGKRNDDYWMQIKIHFGRRTTAPSYTCILPEEKGFAGVTSFLNSVAIRPDKTIPDVLDRNPSWTKMLIVCDVTGSMAKYNVTMFSWIRKKLEEDQEKIKRIVFFNDGDNNQKKIIGSTGGIYPTESKEFSEIMETAKECMMNGSGGDTPENNIEAVLEGIKKSTGIGEIIMIADNFATPRDIELIPQIKKPVRVIVCGGYDGAVNLAYLNLARSTGGSVHTDEKDFMELASYKERESFSIGNFSYIIRKGKIELE